MRILLYTPAPENAGGFFRCFFLAKHLTAEGFDTTVLCGSKRLTKRFAAKVKEGVKIVTLPRQCNISGIFLADLKRIKILWKTYLAGDWDILHIFVSTIPSSASLALLAKMLKLTRIRTNTRVIIDWDDWWSGRGIWKGYGFLFRFFGKYLEEIPPRLADAVTCVSDVLKARALSIGIKEDHVFKITNASNFEGVPLYAKSYARKKLRISEEIQLLTHVGFTHPDAFNALIRAFEIVVRLHPFARLLLIGKIREVNLRRVLLSKSRSKIDYIGIKPYNQIPLYLAASDVLLISMKDDIEERARFPIRLGDYLAAERPIVAAAPQVSETAKIIENCACGLTAKPEDSDDFAARITTILDSPKLSPEFGRNSRKLAERQYSWRTVAGKLRETYYSLI